MDRRPSRSTSAAEGRSEWRGSTRSSRASSSSACGSRSRRRLASAWRPTASSSGWTKMGRGVGTAGFEPAISCTQSRRIARLSHIPEGRNAPPEHPVRESNPPLRRERAVSCADRRTGRGITIRQWAGWRSNPRLHLFRVALSRVFPQPLSHKQLASNASQPVKSSVVVEFTGVSGPSRPGFGN